jgi:hypothetical protein
MSLTSAAEISTYEPKPSLQNAAKVGLQAGVVGTFVSAIQNALGTHSHGAAGFLTRSGGTIGVFGTFWSLRIRDITHIDGLGKPLWVLRSR